MTPSAEQTLNQIMTFLPDLTNAFFHEFRKSYIARREN